ncbi:hypothetical protein AGMMS49921_11340 [Endomicrobiia bacterium]|nr:hypothetical protein AGMMS49921_11340 [Endomicrobiia bacterium]
MTKEDKELNREISSDDYSGKCQILVKRFKIVSKDRYSNYKRPFGLQSNPEL